METFPTGRIRNVAVAGHSGVGKTTLVEALLAYGRAIERPGRVEDGTTATDHDPDEIARGHSIDLELAAVELADSHGQPVKLNLIDTPGDANFAYQASCALAAADAVLLVVGATTGVDFRTVELWREAKRLGRSCMFAVNGVDREHADFDRVLDALRSHFGPGIAPVVMPLADGEGADRVVDLLSDHAFRYAGGGDPAGVPCELPEALAAREHGIHDALVEGIIVGDDSVMERYLDGETIGFDELEGVLALGVTTGTVVPVMACSATAGTGVDQLALHLADLAPAPVMASDPQLTLRAFAAKSDPYVGRLTYCRVEAGQLAADAVVANARTRAEERLHNVETRVGARSVPLGGASAGDLVVVGKLGPTAAGDVLRAKAAGPLELGEFPAPPEPAFAVAIHPSTRNDEDKLMTGLTRLCEEDPSIRVVRDDETHQTLVAGSGETHVAVLLERLARRFGVNVEREPLRIPYRASVSASARAVGKHKKQTGGHGQFGVVDLEVAPGPRGSGFEFVDRVVGGAIPKQYLPAVRKGVEEALATAGPGGVPVVDVTVTCWDGKYHPVDSSEASFQMAGALALRMAIEEAGPVVLEPIDLVTVTVPTECQGDVLGDLSSRRGRVQGTDLDGDGEQVITALVPAAEMTAYATELRALTSGRGHFTAAVDHYEPAPPQVAEAVAAEGAKIHAGAH